jgi:hypothetical protein
VLGQVDDLGGLLAVAVANATNIEASRGLLGFLNTLGGWALRAAHAARSNTISGAPPRCPLLPAGTQAVSCGEEDLAIISEQHLCTTASS